MAETCGTSICCPPPPPNTEDDVVVELNHPINLVVALLEEHVKHIRVAEL